jgi:uncharacterized protein (TIGR03435 family)
MHWNFERMQVRRVERGSLTALIAVMFAMAPLWAHPKKGTPAPPLTSLHLLQAPSGATADWTSLKGKVVVLDFWATWCSPCIASLPHLNQLVASLNPAKFQFISIDNEDLRAIETFLTRKKMSGWVGVDATGKVLSSYGVNSWPTTVIVDGKGKVVAVTDIESVSAADLEAVAEGKNVAFKPDSEITTATAASRPANAPQALFAISLTKASPDANMSTVEHPPTGTDLLGVDADSLIASAFNVFEGRYFLKDQLPDGRYDLQTNFVDVPHGVSTSVVQQAVLSALHLQVQSRTVTKPAYILRATEASRDLLSLSASTRAMKRGYWHGIFILMNGTLDDLAYVLATGLENPVINETGIDGKFDARFKVDGGDVDSLNAVLRKTLGLELVPGTEEKSITVQEVSRQEESKPSSSTTKAQEIKH